MPTDLRFPAPDGTIFQTRAALICIQDEALLTCWDKRYPDFYTLPGGAIHTNETAHAAAQREWQEELGEADAPVELCGVVENFFLWEGQEGHELGFLFRVRSHVQAPPRMLDHLNVAFRWLPLADLHQYTIYPVCLPELIQTPAGQISHLVTDTRA